MWGFKGENSFGPKTDPCFGNSYVSVHTVFNQIPGFGGSYINKFCRNSCNGKKNEVENEN